MPARNGRNRRRRPLDQILNPQLPTSPLTTGDGGQVSIPGGEPPLTPLDDVLDDTGGNGGGVEDPWINPFMEVYETTEVAAMKRLEEMQKSMAESFAHRGGYFGGKHAIAQGEMAAKTGSYLDQLLAETKMGATEKSYEAWRESRGEFMNLISLIPSLIGSETFENIIQMPGKEWLGDLAKAGGAAAGAAASSREFKKDISEVSEEDEKAIFKELTSTPLFRYRYKFEADDISPHLGLITGNSPAELTLFDNKAIGLLQYISALHATVKVMSKKIERLESGE